MIACLSFNLFGTTMLITTTTKLASVGTEVSTRVGIRVRVEVRAGSKADSHN